MQRHLTAAVAALAILVAACGGSASPSPSQAASAAASAAGSAAASSAASTAASPSAAGFDVNSISGPVTLSGWQSSPAEGNALTQALLGFESAYPNIKVDYQPVAGDYPTVMATKFASKDVPDLMYVNADVASTWIGQGFFAPLDDYIAKSGFDTSQFFDGYASIFKGTDGKTYGFPKDGNTIAMAYNTALVTTPPTTMDELITLAKSLKGKDGLKAPICLNPGLDRGLAFLYAQGGSLLTADNKASAIDTAASKAAVQWYMDLFKNGLGMTASDMGAGWCGDALGKKSAAITFEGGWLDPSMTSTYPDVKYAWAQMPTGSSGSPVTISYTVSYSIPADAKNKDQAWVLLQYLTGKDGMTLWTQGGVALPARKDVASPAGKDVLTASNAFAKPGSGFMPGYNDVQKAFQDAFTSQIQAKTFDAGPVVTATKAAIDKALAGG
jgi:multiple sugar transport system substrate-binding protein